ncbi:MAG: response regulator [Verrucomicrobia subdivision 3 bacterium]|nr:response regulator [Limisphaerales bacterium]
MSDKILIIDDERDFIELIRWNLSGGDYEILTAESGMTGLHMARRHLPDVILLDLALPDIDGLSVCEILRKQPSTADIPVVMVTARCGELTRAHAADSGACHYLSKPFDRQSLVSCVERLLRERDAKLEAEALAPEGALLSPSDPRQDA